MPDPEQLSAKETERRREAALSKMLATPPSPAHGQEETESQEAQSKKGLGGSHVGLSCFTYYSQQNRL